MDIKNNKVRNLKKKKKKRTINDFCVVLDYRLL